MKILNSLRRKKPEDQTAPALKNSITYKGGTISVFWNEATEDPVEINIFDTIGEDPWDGGGFTEKHFRDALTGIPKNRELGIKVNSRGGDVYEGFGIMNAIEEWPAKVVCTITGVAASTASWMILAADEVRAGKGCQMFIHDAMTFRYGNADAMREAADNLDKTSDQIAGFYADKTGKSVKEMRKAMKDNTLMTGQEAKNLGLIDIITSDAPVTNFMPEEISAMKNRILNSAPREQGEHKNNKQPQEDKVNRQAKIALLNSWGIKVTDDPLLIDNRIDELISLGRAGATNSYSKFGNAMHVAEQTTPPAQSNSSDIAELQRKIDNLTTANTEAKRQRLSAEVQTLINEDRIPETLRNETLEDLMLNEKRLDSYYKKLTPKRPGSDPVGNSIVEISGESFTDVQNYILENSVRFRKNFLGQKAQNEIGKEGLREISARGIVAANTISKHKDMLVSMFNVNAIDADLQRAVILQDMLEAYAIELLALEAFSVKYENVPLEGTDKVVVPYFPLQATASKQFAKATGFGTASDWTQNSRAVTIGGDGDTTTCGDNATAGTAKDRLYQRIDFTSYDMRRQPYLNVAKLAKQAANKLAVDVFSQIVSRVIVVGNFGAAVKTVAAPMFGGDDIADLAEYATAAYWPVVARSLVLNHTYKTPLLKEATFKQYLSYGSTDPVRKAMIQEAYGFQDMYFIANLAAKLAADTAGWINHQSAVLVAFAPVMPTPEVRALLTTYDIAVDPKSGAVLEYRKFGNATLDTTVEAIQSCFGAAKGVDAALQIIKSA